MVDEEEFKERLREEFSCTSKEREKVVRKAKNWKIQTSMSRLAEEKMCLPLIQQYHQCRLLPMISVSLVNGTTGWDCLVVVGLVLMIAHADES